MLDAVEVQKPQDVDDEGLLAFLEEHPRLALLKRTKIVCDIWGRYAGGRGEVIELEHGL